VLRGEDGPDILVGSPHDDSIRGGLGNDRLYGLAGFDSAEYLTAPSGVAVDLAGGSATGGDGTDQLSGFEDAFGSSHNDVLRGSAGADALSGNSGNDYLQGRGGNDQLFGGPGFDAALYTGASGPVTVSLLAGSSSGADGSDTLNTIEAVFGSPFNDVLVGDNNPNTLSGQDGNDHLWGLGANDVLLGNAGNDDMNGGTGTDTCSQGTGSGTSSACELP
jgi:Ca2+-binding RTX toxin-like protein